MFRRPIADKHPIRPTASSWGRVTTEQRRALIHACLRAPDWQRHTKSDVYAMVRVEGCCYSILCGFGNRPSPTRPERPLYRPSRLASCSVLVHRTSEPPRGPTEHRTKKEALPGMFCSEQNRTSGKRQGGGTDTPRKRHLLASKRRDIRLSIRKQAYRESRCGISLAFHSIANQR